MPLKQTLQRLLIELAQVKAGNSSESFMNEIKQVIYSQSKFRKTYTVVNSKISYRYGLVLNLTDKMDLRRGDKHVALSDLSI